MRDSTDRDLAVADALDEMADAHIDVAYQRGVADAIAQVQEVKEDAQEKLGLVTGNTAFENGRIKACNQIITELEAIASSGEKK